MCFHFKSYYNIFVDILKKLTTHITPLNPWLNVYKYGFIDK